MKFVYPNQYDDEPVGIENKVLPILNEWDIINVNKAIFSLSCNGGDREMGRKAALEYLGDMLRQVSCTCEKDSFTEYIEGIIKVMYLFDHRKDIMIEDLNYVVYQMF